jgi:hypothetical protein
MAKYKYSIRMHIVKDMQELEEILNRYGSEGFRITKVERTDNLLYEGFRMKYSIFLEEKCKNE